MLPPQFCTLPRQGICCHLPKISDDMPPEIVSRMSLQDIMLNKLIVVMVVSMNESGDNDTCLVMLPFCPQNQQQIPLLVRSVCELQLISLD